MYILYLFLAGTIFVIEYRHPNLCISALTSNWPKLAYTTSSMTEIRLLYIF